MRKSIGLLILCAILISADDSKKSSKSKNVPEKDDFDTNLYKSFYTEDNRKLSIYNNFLKPTSLYLLKRYLFTIGQWEVTLNDYNNGSDFKEDSPDHVLWKIFPDPEFIGKTKIGQKIIRAVRHFKGDQQGNDYQIYHVAAKLIARSEIPKSSQDAPMGNGDVSAILYLIGKWKKNDYGDILFYDNNKEIIGAVHPLIFRMIMFDSSIEHQYKTPSVDHEGPVITLQVKLTQSKEKVNNAIEQWKARSQLRSQAREKTLNQVAPIQAGQVIDVDKHITRTYTAPNGKKMYVLDNLYTAEELKNLRKLIEYKRYDHDGNFDEGSDGVSWAASFSLQDFVDSNLWNVHQQVVRHVGSRTTYFPYDVSCNMIRCNDKTRVHDDCSQVADQWTMVTYLNPNWTAQMGGETAYFEKNIDDNFYITEVRPRYGRSVIFQSTLYHSARPPANDFDGLRYTFSVKMAEDEAQARVNRLTEDFSIYAGNIDLRDSVTRIGRMMGTEKGEKMVLRMLLGEDAPQVDDEGEGKTRGKGQYQDEEEEDQSPAQKDQSVEDEAEEEELEYMLDDYRNPHRKLVEVTNKDGVKKRAKLIKTIDKHRDNGKIMAKLQNSLEENMHNSYAKVSAQIAPYL
ncbi:hypothetical protein TrispH2_008816 [Trichoplax sp. H2]|uniref:Prolyl 4-hydroxylase alpha subunit Fe(2+) 2OG dioxygenase domain-containing protein n=1 Tax=Trichoplax adhaerens TaxID=10228 RepID=B3RZK4_TRIAD|nr:hypothetical protein TRIADDRAFT_64016 [Trichoplax adhaerens]EDV24222.1 hypothetical protein TRIADDRAFT_64016 [Trichoplax adhaerens]RDD39133.1 hypothetical protein TrispH2_008816 [Trichoplax sp. H2]|eukprot:XP_002113748.1 hypothetical protein TRIADDRAFT_64016 [Trichoplax adhaerens]